MQIRHTPRNIFDKKPVKNSAEGVGTPNPAKLVNLLLRREEEVPFASAATLGSTEPRRDHIRYSGVSSRDEAPRRSAGTTVSIENRRSRDATETLQDNKHNIRRNKFSTHGALRP